MKKIVHVAVGVIFNTNGQILIARRPDHVHQGGLWEFPGGKVDADELVEAALTRELREELAIHVEDIEPLIKISHEYADKSVLLDVYKVTRFSGEARGNEGQPTRWVSIAELINYSFPAANHAIISALGLPDLMMITGQFSFRNEFIKKIEIALSRGIKLIQLRCPTLSSDEYILLANDLKLVCANHQAKLIINTGIDLFKKIGGDGIHLNRHELMKHNIRPVDRNIILGASCHNEMEIAQARLIGVDYVCISPITATTSHPGAVGIGWAEFARLARMAAVPAFALGGMTRSYIQLARQHEGYGVAGIRDFWPE